MVAATTTWANAETIKISSDPWEPWVHGKSGEIATGGWGVDIAREMFNRMNLKSETKIFPYERCLRQMQTGERDVLLMVKKTKEREAYMLFSDVTLQDPQLAYYSVEHTKKFEWNDWADFTPFSVGGVRGFNYGEFNTAVTTHGIRMELAANDEQNIRKVLSGRIDIALLNYSTAEHFIANKPKFKYALKSAQKPVSLAKFHIALSKKGKAANLLPQINKVLAEMESDGTLDRLTLRAK